MSNVWYYKLKRQKNISAFPLTFSTSSLSKQLNLFFHYNNFSIPSLSFFFFYYKSFKNCVALWYCVFLCSHILVVENCLCCLTLSSLIYHKPLKDSHTHTHVGTHAHTLNNTPPPPLQDRERHFNFLPVGSHQADKEKATSLTT